MSSSFRYKNSAKKPLLRINEHGDLPFLLQKLHDNDIFNLFRKLFKNRQCSFFFKSKKLVSQKLHWQFFSNFEI